MLFKQFEESETTSCDEISDEVVWTIKNNVLFLDPRKRLLKPQSRSSVNYLRDYFSTPEFEDIGAIKLKSSGVFLQHYHMFLGFV